MSRCLRLIIIAALAVVAGSAMAQPEPPGRVARLDHTEGRVMFSPSGASTWTEAPLNRPLVRGDRIQTEKATRAEIQAGSTVVRMDADTRLEVLAMGDDSVQLALTQGSVQVHVRSLPEGENFEIDTPNLAYRSAYPGQARIDVDGAGGSTRVSIRSGAGTVYGERGQALPLGGGQQVTLRERSLALGAAQESPSQDNFDRWAAERDRRDEQSLAARYVPRELVGYQWLDAHGQWGHEPSFGPVWFPSVQPADWAPYRVGHWEWIEPWGWTWIDEAPWAFATSHYGRWAMVGARWAWVPGQLPLRPAYAPALVAFAGGPGAAPLSIAGKPSFAWFPLAPGEPWQPDKREAATPYVDRVNTQMRPLPATGFAYQRKPEALSATAADDFARNEPVRAGRVSVGGPLLAQLQVRPAPAMPARLTQDAAAQEQARKQEQEQATRPPAPAADQPGAPPVKAAQSPPQTRKTRSAESSPAQKAKKPQAKRQRAARSDSGAKREAKTAGAGREQPAVGAQPSKRSAAAAKKPGQARSTHARQVEAARKAADREAQQLRVQREEAERRKAAEQERLRRDASQRQAQSE